MLSFKYKNLSRSEFVENTITTSMEGLLQTCPILDRHSFAFTLSRENGPMQPGPDSFSLSVWIHGPFLKSFQISKKGGNVYALISRLTESIEECIHRHTEKSRTRKRHQAREFRTRQQQSLRSA